MALWRSRYRPGSFALKRAAGRLAERAEVMAPWDREEEDRTAGLQRMGRVRLLVTAANRRCNPAYNLAHNVPR